MLRQETHRVHKRRPSCAKTAIPCALSARTGTPQGANESPRKCQYGFSAAIHALFTINGDTPKAWPKTMAKTATGALQHRGRRQQRPSKIEAGGTHESPDATKSVQEACKRCPRDALERPKAAQKRPKCGQAAPKTGLGGTQTPPKTNPASSKTRTGHDRHWQPPSPGYRGDFPRFDALRAWLATCENCGVVILKAFRPRKRACMQNRRKITPWNSQNLPGATRNPPKSSPDRAKTY